MTSRYERWAREAYLMEIQLTNPDLDSEEREQIERALAAYEEKIS